ncbi:hypothetical protein L1987_78572 [Smallanthus sonchifolius]|uniref:Uncharacterized protein n=1 Tax=Smallanthus sonchifolius TaxID=185202 RepID=A0ACB8ZE24_9ASTR|nr:hypothetical protein L1987_78572 [Smallanthus sonchifolius]
MDVDLHKQNGQGNSLAVFDQSEDDNYYANSPVSEGLRFSQSVHEFKEIKSLDDFSIVVDDLVIDSEIPKHFLNKYCDLCLSQKTYLHEKLLKGLNVKLAVGIIHETVAIADAIRACKVGVTRDDFDTWDKTILLEAKKIEQVKAEDDMRIISNLIKNLDAEIETLKLKGKNLELVFCKEANAPW